MDFHAGRYQADRVFLCLIVARNKVAVPEGAAGTPPFWRDEFPMKILGT